MEGPDEYDALLEEPFGEGVDWTAVDGMAGGTGAGHNAAAEAEPLQAGTTTESDEYFNNDEAFDESFLTEVRRLESQVTPNTPVVNALPYGGIAETIPTATASSSRPFHPNLGIAAHNVAGSSSVAPASFQTPPPAARLTAVASGPGSPQSTLSTAQGNHPSDLDPLPSGGVPPNERNQTNTFWDLPPPTATLVADHSPVSRGCSSTPSNISPQPSPTRKRHRSTASYSGVASSRYKANCRQKASKVLEAIEKVLECPICFDTIAAPHILTCGHSACGLCLCEWIRRKGGNATCCICRAPHRGALLPNYALDNMAATYFNEKGNQEGLGETDGEDRRRWEKRKADGKAAVEVAGQKHFIKAPPLPPVAIRIPSAVSYDGQDEGDPGLYGGYTLEDDGFHLYDDSYGEETVWYI